MGKPWGAGICAAMLLLAAAGCSRAPEDSLVAADVRNRIGADDRIQASQLKVSAAHGVVSLSGMVSDEGQRVEAAEDASQAEGVRVLVNNLRVVDSQAPVEANLPPHGKPAQTVPAPAPQKAALASKKPSPVIVRQAESASTLPIVTDSSPVNASGSNPIQTASVTNPAATLPTHPLSVPVSSASAMSSTSAAPVPPKPEKVVIPYGTVLSVRLLDTVGTDLNQPGDRFTASLASPVMIDDQVVVPADAALNGKVIQVQDGGRFSGKPSLAIELSELSYNGKTYSLNTSQFAKEGTSRATNTVEKVGGGAGVGAILGAIVGGGRGAAIGAAIGAGVGSGVQAKSKPNHVELPAESLLSFRLKNAIDVEPSATLLRAPSHDQEASADPYPSDRPVLKRRRGAGAADPPPPPPDTSNPSVNQPPDSTNPDSTDPDSGDRPVLKRRPN